jgi:Ran GTPase-activating protein (RanGAP) involved in mRNA processing and transport
MFCKLWRALTKLGLHGCSLGHDEARLLLVALCNIPNLQSLGGTDRTLWSAELAELAPALCRNTSIKVLDISGNHLNSMESAEILRDILRSTKTITTLDLSGNAFGPFASAVDCIAEGWAATQRCSRSTFHTVPWEMAVFPLWRKLSVLGTRRYRNSHPV